MIKNARNFASIRLLGAAMAATLFGLTASTLAQIPPVPHSLLITENSSDALTVTYDGSTITPVQLASDHWQFTLPDLVHLGTGEGSFGTPSGAAVQEPEGGLAWNNVFTSTTSASPYSNLVDVRSDSPTTSAFALSFSDDVSGLVGYDSTGRAINLTFDDDGDGSTTVPDSGSTATLGLISLVALFAGARLRLVRAR